MSPGSTEPSRRDGLLICIPPAGSGASSFGPWKRVLGDGLWAVRLPGRETSHAEPLLTGIGEMAAFVWQQMQERDVRDAVLYGHSMGALVAYEVASMAHASPSGHVAGLIVSACRAPDRFQLPSVYGISDDDAFLDRVIRLGGIPRSLLDDADFRGYFLPILRADFAACSRYAWHPRDPLTIPILVNIGLDDDSVSPSEAEEWKRFTVGQTEAHRFPGDHFFFRDGFEPVLSTVRSWRARVMDAGLGGAQSAVHAERPPHQPIAGSAHDGSPPTGAGSVTTSNSHAAETGLEHLSTKWSPAGRRKCGKFKDLDSVTITSPQIAHQIFY